MASERQALTHLAMLGTPLLKWRKIAGSAAESSGFVHTFTCNLRLLIAVGLAAL